MLKNYCLLSQVSSLGGRQDIRDPWILQREARIKFKDSLVEFGVVPGKSPPTIRQPGYEPKLCEGVRVRQSLFGIQLLSVSPSVS